VEKKILISILKHTKESQTSYGKLQQSVRVTNEVLESVLKKLASEKLIEKNEDALDASMSQRLGIAIKAINYGADFERVSRALGWLEFEEIVAHVFEENGYRVGRRFRFQAYGRRWEIDVLATRKPLIVCVECKHWLRGLSNSSARRIAENHLEKVKALSENASRIVKKLKLRFWDRALVVP